MKAIATASTAHVRDLEEQGAAVSPCSASGSPSGGRRTYRQCLPYRPKQFAIHDVIRRPVRSPQEASPAGYADYKEALQHLPAVYRRSGREQTFFRNHSEIKSLVDRVLLKDLGPKGLCDEALQSVLLRGEQPARFRALLTLIENELFDARVAVPICDERLPGGKVYAPLPHRIAGWGSEPEDASSGLSLFDRFIGLRLTGVSLGLQTRNGWSPLHFAALTDNEETAQALVKCKVDLNAQSDLGFSALMLAASRGSCRVVDCLVGAKGVDLNLRTRAKGASVMHLLVEQNSAIGLALLKRLLEAGAEPLIQDAEGNTPLHQAVESGNLLALEALLAAIHPKCRPNMQNFTKRQTALHRACKKGRVDMVRLLLEHGAHVSLRDCKNRTPRELAGGDKNIEAEFALYLRQPKKDASVEAVSTRVQSTTPDASPRVYPQDLAAEMRRRRLTQAAGDPS